ncbi:hypothetical protein [Kosakonia sp. R1.Fl]|uniref:hypothetical protein n=1 Tax=Kosakonia sp. R1.Fl TaxID=2928706 RepID=UPI00201DF2B2|nr:hypothetical protein [Kosakonia sp. R1.Fl]MCL6746897.1 hypothetical protein [Kosakonia sp. R1.Fl]
MTTEKHGSTLAYWFRCTWEIALTAVVSAIVTCLFILVAVLVFRMTETGSAVDWLSAILNLATVLTAIAAFVVARSWLPQLTTQEGYKLAISLVNDEIRTLDRSNPLKDDVNKAVQAVKNLGNRRTILNTEPEITKLRSIITSAEKRRKKMRDLRKKMETYGLEPATDRAAALEKMLTALGKCIDRANTAQVLLMVLSLKGSITELSQEFINSDRFSMIERLNNGEDLETLTMENLSELDKAWWDMTREQEEFLGKNSQIGKLFKVRR